MTAPQPPDNRPEDPALAAGQARPNPVPGPPPTAAGLASDATSGQSSQRYTVPPDPGCYEIRFRLTWFTVLSISLGLALIALSIFSHGQISKRIFGIWIGGLCTVPYLILLISRTLFRADQAGITLGLELGRSGFSRTVFIPWTDIEKIALYKITRRSAQAGRKGSYIQNRAAWRVTSRIRRSSEDRYHVAALAPGPRAPGRRRSGGGTAGQHRRRWEHRSLG